MLTTSVIQSFSIAGDIVDFKQFGSGHINNTFLVKTSSQKYVFQRINHSIFKNVPELMQNIKMVIDGLPKIKQAKAPALHFELPKVIPTLGGDLYTIDEKGNYWRCLSFIEDSHSLDLVESAEVVEEGGRAFGLFQWLLSGLEADKLFYTIPNFHNLEKRYQAYLESKEKNFENRIASIGGLIETIESRAPIVLEYDRLTRTPSIPLRITHNDTKFNNILFNSQGKAISIVDLDTVMPGTLLHDFGDAIRTGCCTAMEDEEDLSKVSVNLSFFQAYTRGYLHYAKNFITKEELDNLAFSSLFMTYVMGIRFATDYLNGDIYYQVHKPKHNLLRANAQFAMYKDLEKNLDTMKKIVTENS